MVVVVVGVVVVSFYGLNSTPSVQQAIPSGSIRVSEARYTCSPGCTVTS